MTLDRVCPRCGRKIPDDAAFCPYCSMNLRTEPLPARTAKKTGFPIAAGILIIIGACVTVLIGILGLVGFAETVDQPWLNYYTYNYPHYDYLFMGFFGVLGFAFGLAGGIFCLKRTHFTMSILGVCLLLVSGFVTIAAFASEGSFEGGLLFGLPTLILSILGIVFVAISKGEFD